MFVNKKGEATWFMVSLILVVISLVVLFTIFSQISWSENIDRQICHESVVIRGTLTGNTVGKLGGAELAPLKCSTRRICVTDKLLGKGECENEFGQDFVTVRISGNSVERENKIKTFLAREMADCWSMMGEGKLQLFKNSLLDFNSYSTIGVTCSRIMFDETILNDEKNSVKEVKSFARYLLSHRVQGKEISYWDYFRDTSDGTTLAELKGDIADDSFTEKDKLNLTRQKAIIFVELDNNAGLTTVGAGVAGVVGLTLTRSTTIASVCAVGGAYLGEVANQKFSKLGDQDYASGLFLTDYSAEGIRKIGIEKFENVP